MAYFGTDSSDEREAVRDAVEASVMMHFVNDAYLSPWLTTQGLWAVPFKVGIDHGAVTIAKIGIHGTNQFVAIGATANCANRLLRTVTTGISIGNEVYSRLPPNWDRACVSIATDTGFVYRISGQPYPAWELKHRMTGTPYT